MDIFEAIQKRRSVRKYTGAPVPREHLERIVDCGRLAASGSNVQPWEFIVVTDRAMIGQLKGDKAWLNDAAAMICLVMDSSSRWWIEDGAAATQNMCLAATALGYGSCWLEGYTVRREEEFKALLGVPPDRRLMTILSVGVPAEWPTKEKKALADVLRWERY
jgi:nitroreductase